MEVGFRSVGRGAGAVRHRVAVLRDCKGDYIGVHNDPCLAKILSNQGAVGESDARESEGRRQRRAGACEGRREHGRRRQARARAGAGEAKGSKGSATRPPSSPLPPSAGTPPLPPPDLAASEIWTGRSRRARPLVRRGGGSSRRARGGVAWLGVARGPARRVARRRYGPARRGGAATAAGGSARRGARARGGAVKQREAGFVGTGVRRCGRLGRRRGEAARGGLRRRRAQRGRHLLRRRARRPRQRPHAPPCRRLARRGVPLLAAVGARDFPGVHLCRFSDDAPASAPGVLSWPDSPSATVLSMAATSASGVPQPPPWLFASFESSRNSSAMVAFDLNSMSPVAEIGRREVFGADVEAAIPATNLGWVGGHNLLLAAGSHSGPAGVVGDIRMWDVRASATMPVWEVREKEDCFADVAASNTLSALFKVGAASGEVFMADLRRLGGGGIGLEPWVCIGDGQRVAMAASSGRKDGNGCKIECYYSWVFVARGADVRCGVRWNWHLKPVVRS